ncbi:hypothetical protein MC885_011976 [Smutsia gigantea]|nr:hypothetical protein MC885_011976 [Smutsia gigantea]
MLSSHGPCTDVLGVEEKEIEEDQNAVILSTTMSKISQGSVSSGLASVVPGLVEAIIVNFIEPILQGQDGREPMTPQDLTGDKAHEAPVVHSGPLRQVMSRHELSCVAVN